MDPKKQALLQKRKKYDPRAAIKNSKKPSTIPEVVASTLPEVKDSRPVTPQTTQPAITEHPTETEETEEAAVVPKDAN
jgi:hypothetical protein